MIYERKWWYDKYIMFFKNTSWCRRFLKNWWSINEKELEKYKTKHFHEQDVLKYYIKENKYNINSHLEIFSL